MMKTIILILTIIFSINMNAQVTDTPEIDSLHDLYLETITKWQKSVLNYELDIRWIEFQIHQWKHGKWRKVKYWRRSDRNDGVLTLPRDTTIFVPQPINFKEFMEWRLEY